MTLCALSIQTVPVDEGEGCAQLNIRGHQGQCQMIQCVPKGNGGKRPDFLRRKTHPGRTATPKERGSLRHPHGSRSAVFVNSAYRVITSVNIQKYQGHMTILCARGMWKFWVPEGMSFCLKIMRPCHRCWNPASQVWLALLLLPQPHSWLELGHHVSITFMIHYI